MLPLCLVRARVACVLYMYLRRSDEEELHNRL